LVSTAPFHTAWQAYTVWRTRWGIENSGFCALRRLAFYRSSLDLPPQRGHNRLLTFTLVADNVA